MSKRHSATDTVLLLYYGNASATDQQDKVNVWDSNTKGVWHFNNTITDSTSNANNGTNYSSSNTTSGKIADARDFVSTSNRVTTANTSSLKPTSAITVSAWVKRSGTQVDYAKPLWFGQVASSPWGPYGFQMDEATNNLLFHVSSNSTGYWMAPAAALSDNAWTLVTGTYDGTSVKYYVNGTLQSGQSVAFTIGNYDGTNGLGVGDSYASGSEWKGTVDEARISSTARSQDWITTEYNNQNSPGTFLALSDALGASSNTTYVYDYRNRMVGTSGSTTSSYGYDVSGERVKATLGGVTTISPTRGYSLEGSTPVKQIYAGSTLVATVKGTGAGAAVYTVATDHLTGSNAISNGSGTLEELLDYYPYGSVRIDEKAGSFDQKRKFAGHEYDGETGLSYMVARYYDGGVGRFYGQDPVFMQAGGNNSFDYLSDPQSMNSYAYARNNPMAYQDLDGLYPVRSQITDVRHDSQIMQTARQNEKIVVANNGTSYQWLSRMSAGYGSIYTKSVNNNYRYVYVTQGGWIDMQHFFYAAKTATKYGYSLTVNGGWLFEKGQRYMFIKPASGDSFEDQTSNMLGAYFAAYYLPGKLDEGYTASEALEMFFQDVGMVPELGTKISQGTVDSNAIGAKDGCGEDRKQSCGTWTIPEGYTQDDNHPRKSSSSTSKKNLDAVTKKK